jgi:acyl carrier protein
MLAGANHGAKPMVRDGIQCANERHSMRRGGRVRDVTERIKKIIAELLGVDKAQVTENAIFIDDLGADSLEAVELVMAFEEAFGCEIPEGAVEQIVTVQDAINFIETHSHN